MRVDPEWRQFDSAKMARGGGASRRGPSGGKGKQGGRGAQCGSRERCRVSYVRMLFVAC